MPRLKDYYDSDVKAALAERFGYKSVMEVPKLNKIVINMGIGEAKENPKFLENAIEELRAITGQQPIVLQAKKSVANFKVRQGMNVGLMVTLRGQRMYEFLDRLVSVALPRVRDFRGLNPNSFDGRGNYSMGIREQLVFPEIRYDDVEAIRGMDITIVTTAQTDEEARELLTLMGLPYRK
ncbi:MAG TPA: 50S ribosomal protein L5 [Tissierellia bacterium]|jgi:large subunit ribosomal protein L5|nr:50S ribosomal protein L5 [Tissierellia bacterium]